MSILSLENLTLRYDPFPIGVAPSACNVQDYTEMIRSWPEQGKFAFMPALGNKYSLSEVNHSQQYFQVIGENNIWGRVYAEIKKQDFIDRVITKLLSLKIDLDLGHYHVANGHLGSGWYKRMQRVVGRLLHQLQAQPSTRLHSRFEFSMLPCPGGHIKPHTDHPKKIITLVLTIVDANEWNHDWGGGTTVLKPKDVSDTFNQINRQLDFQSVEPIVTYPFYSNQLLLFIKTFNSLHAVYPMNGPQMMRRSLTINIERI